MCPHFAIHEYLNWQGHNCRNCFCNRGRPLKACLSVLAFGAEHMFSDTQQ